METGLRQGVQPDHVLGRFIADCLSGNLPAVSWVIAPAAYTEHPADRPVKFQEVFATLYKCAGIDARNIRVFDLAGVPQYLVEPGIEPRCSNWVARRVYSRCACSRQGRHVTLSGRVEVIA